MATFAHHILFIIKCLITVFLVRYPPRFGADLIFSLHNENFTK